MMHARMKIAVLILFALGITSSVQSEESDEWQFSWSPYLYAFSLDGEAGLGGLESKVDMEFGDFLDLLDIGTASYSEARKGRFFFANDISYFKLSVDVDLDRVRSRGLFGNNDVFIPARAGIELDAKASQWGIKSAIGYRLVDHLWGEEPEHGIGQRFALDVFTGILYNRVDMDIDGLVDVQVGQGSPIRTVDIDFEDTEEWLQHLYSVRAKFGITDRLALQISGDLATGYEANNLFLGGKVVLNYSLNHYLSAIVGYQVIDFDYEDDGFIYDLTYQGPYLGLVFHF